MEKSFFLLPLLLIFTIDAHIFVYNDTKNRVSVQVKPVGSTQYTKSCETQSFYLKSKEKYQITDVQGAYPCPDVHIQIKGNTDAQPTNYQIKLYGYDFEGSLGMSQQGDKTVYIVQKKGIYRIKIADQPPKS